MSICEILQENKRTFLCGFKEVGNSYVHLIKEYGCFLFSLEIVWVKKLAWRYEWTTEILHKLIVNREQACHNAITNVCDMTHKIVCKEMVHFSSAIPRIIVMETTRLY